MKKTWAISGVDLHLDLTGSRVREGLERALREAVQSGRLVAGARLPSSRSLASDLGIARNTVTEAYDQLVAEGWLTARQGSGTRVAAVESRVSPGRRKAAVSPDRPGAWAAKPGTRYDLTPGSPDLSTFPRAEWASSGRRALLSAPSAALGYGDPRGVAEFRHALSQYLARVRGVRASPDRIVVCSGYVQALALVSAALRMQDAGVVAMEAVSLGVHRRVIESSGLGTVPAPVDGDGVVVSGLESVTADAALVTPAHQFPLGGVLAPERRAAVIQWAERTGAVVIEDDYDGEFRYDRHPVGALQALDPERVVYAGTASMSLAPGLRLAWLTLPPRMVDAVVAAKVVADLQSSSLDQLTFTDYLKSGRFDRHVRRCRLHYRRRRDRLVELLRERVPEVSVSGIAAGLHAIVELPGEAGIAAEATQQAAQAGLAVHGLARYRYEPDVPTAPALVVGYGTPPEHGYAGAIEALCASLRSVLD